MAPLPDEAASSVALHLHHLIAATSGRLFADGHHDSAVFNAYRAVEDRVKRLSGKSEIGKRLMTYVFNENAPTLDITSPNADDDQKGDEREGFKFLFMGSSLGLRNPRGHGGDLNTPEDEAAEMLALASLLMRTLDRAEEQLAQQPPEPETAGEWDAEDGDGDNEPGALDLIAAAEGAMPELAKTVAEMAGCIDTLGEIATAYTPKVDAARSAPTVSARLVVIHELANELKIPAEKFRKLAADYVGQMAEMNGGIDALTHIQPFATMSPEDQIQYLVLAETVGNLRDSARAGLNGAITFSQSFSETAKLSKALKKPSSDFRDGVRQMQSVQHYFDEWVQGFADAGVLDGPTEPPVD